MRSAKILGLILFVSALAWWVVCRLPSTAVTATPQERVTDWCAEHGVPESRCVLCGHGPIPPEPAPSRDDAGARLNIEAPPSGTCTLNEKIVSLDQVRRDPAPPLIFIDSPIL